jgi:hypothetical protein
MGWVIPTAATGYQEVAPGAGESPVRVLPLITQHPRTPFGKCHFDIVAAPDDCRRTFAGRTGLISGHDSAIYGRRFTGAARGTPEYFKHRRMTSA